MHSQCPYKRLPGGFLKGKIWKEMGFLGVTILLIRFCKRKTWEFIPRFYKRL